MIYEFLNFGIVLHIFETQDRNILLSLFSENSEQRPGHYARTMPIKMYLIYLTS